jgi:hypothetical protein
MRLRKTPRGRRSWSVCAATLEQIRPAVMALTPDRGACAALDPNVSKWDLNRVVADAVLPPQPDPPNNSLFNGSIAPSLALPRSRNKNASKMTRERCHASA